MAFIPLGPFLWFRQGYLAGPGRAVLGVSCLGSEAADSSEPRLKIGSTRVLATAVAILCRSETGFWP